MVLRLKDLSNLLKVIFYYLSRKQLKLLSFYKAMKKYHRKKFSLEISSNFPKIQFVKKNFENKKKERKKERNNTSSLWETALFQIKLW